MLASRAAKSRRQLSPSTALRNQLSASESIHPFTAAAGRT